MNLSRHSTNKYFQLMIQFLKFGMVGIANTLISLSVYYVLIYMNANYIFANTMGFFIGVLNAYYWNKRYVFTNEVKSKGKSFIKVSISYGSTFLLSTLLLYIMVDLLLISEWIAPIINLIITVPLNFILNKLWAFK